MMQFIRNYSLSLVLAVLFVASWAAQAYVQVAVEGETWGAFWAATLENWQSEYLQLLSFVVLTSFLIHRGSHESKDGDEDLRARLERIERLLRER